MGDMADWIIEQGMDEWDAHEAGECLDGCPYCPDPEDAVQARRKKETP